MEANQPTDHASHAAGFVVLVAHPQLVAEHHGSVDTALAALGALIKSDCRCWPLSVCPPALAARLFASMERALIAESQAAWLPRQVKH
jgi:hypothetical protein